MPTVLTHPAVALALAPAFRRHGVGLGVALFSPFLTERWFFAFRPILVSPLGVSRFLAGEAWPVLLSELRWVVLPAFVLGGMLWYAGGKRRKES